MPERGVVPHVPLEPVGEEMMRRLYVIWNAARGDARAFERVLEGLERGLISTIFAQHDLCTTIISLCPLRRPDMNPMSPSRWLTLEQMISILWCLGSVACLTLRYLGAFVACSPSSDLYARLANLPSAVRIACGSFPPLDSYAVEVLKGTFDLAVAEPNCLDEYVNGQWTPALPNFAWSLWKLKRLDVLRLQSETSTPVHTLPDELLTLIFVALSEASPAYHSGEADLYNIASHLPSRAVCKRWYDLIMGLPELWSHMNLGFSFKWSRRALELSKTEALDVVVHAPVGHGAISPAILLNLRQFHRIKKLDFRTPWDALNIVAHYMRSYEAPLLETLILQPTDEGAAEHPLNGDSFLGGTLPLLKTVSISQWSIHPGCRIFGAMLVHLDLAYCAVWSSLDSFLVTLRMLHRLESFRWSMSQNALRNLDLPFHFPIGAFLHSEQAIVTLPYLQRLELELPIACIEAIMDHIIIPAPCVLNVLDDRTFSTVEAPDDTVLSEVYHALDASLGAHLERSLSDASGRRIDALHLREDPEATPGRGALLLEGTAGRSHVFAVAFLVPDIIDATLDANTLIGVLRHILGWPVFGDTVAELFTSHEVMANDDFWPMVFDTLPALAALTIEQSADSDASNAVGGFSRALLQEATHAECLVNLTLDHLSLSRELLILLATAIEARDRRRALPLSMDLHFCDGLGEEEETLLHEDMRRYGGQLRVYRSLHQGNLS